MKVLVNGTSSPMCNPKRHNTAGWHGDFLPVTPREGEAGIFADGYREGYRDGRDGEAKFRDSLEAAREARKGADIYF